jgi:hypothetical protein
LKEDISLLQKKLESQKNLSSAYISALGASETEKKELATRFELGEKEAEELRGKTSLLEEQIHEERARSSEFAVKCRKMEEQFSRRSLLGHQPVKSSAIKDIQIRKVTSIPWNKIGTSLPFILCLITISDWLSQKGCRVSNVFVFFYRRQSWPRLPGNWPTARRR